KWKEMIGWEPPPIDGSDEQLTVPTWVVAPHLEVIHDKTADTAPMREILVWKQRLVLIQPASDLRFGKRGDVQNAVHAPRDRLREEHAQATSAAIQLVRHSG